MFCGYRILTEGLFLIRVSRKRGNLNVSYCTGYNKLLFQEGRGERFKRSQLRPPKSSLSVFLKFTYLGLPSVFFFELTDL